MKIGKVDDIINSNKNQIKDNKLNGTVINEIILKLPIDYLNIINNKIKEQNKIKQFKIKIYMIQISK